MDICIGKEVVNGTSSVNKIINATETCDLSYRIIWYIHFSITIVMLMELVELQLRSYFYIRGI